MANERSAVFVRSQYGVETKHGTEVDCTDMFRALKLTATPKVSTHEVDPGGLFPTGYALGKEWTECKAEGIPSYEEIALVMQSLLCKPASDVYNPSNGAENDYESYSIAIGTSGVCEKFAGATFTGVTLKYTPDELTIDADIIGGRITAGTWVSGATEGDITPILGGQCHVELSGATQDRVISADWALTGRWKPFYALAGSNTITNMVEGKPDGSIKVVCEADTQGLAHLTRLRDTNATVAFALKASDGGSNTFDLECATQVKDLDAFEISDTTYNIGYTLGIVYSSTLGYAVKATIT